MADEFHLNGHDTPEAVEDTETMEEIQTVYKRLSELKPQDGSLTRMIQQDLSLLKQFVHHPETADDFIRIVQICDFLDEDERNRELDAFYEAVRLGMSTQYNVAHALSCGSINRKGAHQTSIVGSILDSLQHQKITSNVPRGNERGSSNPRSPLS